ncbi:hypothetical protein GBA52_026184 [Prunus armeniaca]|nr:hypothetical protein GBA52_026184 [Prunus armeniaca]
MELARESWAMLNLQEKSITSGIWKRNNKDVDFDTSRPSLSMVKARLKASGEGKLFLEFLPFFYNLNYAPKFKIELLRRKHP